MSETPTSPSVPTKLSFQDYLACTNLSFSWATAYDTKDWALLASLVTSELHVDYTSVMGPAHLFSSMPVAEYVEMMSNPHTLGNPLVGTQHHLGASSWEVTQEGVSATWQLRAHHVRFEADGWGDEKEENKGRGRVVMIATGHAVIKHFYRRDEGGWKLSGLRPTVLFDEGDLKTLFGL